MKKLDINITKAQLLSYTVELKEGKPECHATIGLFTDGGKKITDYTIFTDSWQDDNKFDLPYEVIPLIGETMRILEGVVVRHCRDGQLALPEPKKDDYVSQSADEHQKGLQQAVRLSINADDEPINLDDIPF
ncbi:MAG TPA: hypothetical protein VNG32_00405 [Candidatus Dormibacteraeota bacterium]|nr:hypothetical protein [Candidatus Dormibacteraeota bacterium]